MSIVCSVTLVLPSCCEKSSLNSSRTGVKLGWTSLGMSSIFELWSLHLVGIACGQSSSTVILWHDVDSVLAFGWNCLWAVIINGDSVA